MNIEADAGWMEDEGKIFTLGKKSYLLSGLGIDVHCVTLVLLEPDPASTDCWAQGSVPKQIIPPRPISPVAEIFDERPDDEDEDVSPLLVFLDKMA